MANFLWKNRHGSYYFRVRIPTKHQLFFQSKAEIRLSLQTSDRAKAKKKARAMMVGLDNLWDKAESMSKENNKDSVTLGYEVVLSSEVDLEGIFKQSTVLKISPEEHETLGDEAVGQLIQNMSKLQSVSAGTQPPRTIRAPAQTSCPSLSKTLDAYVIYSNWSTPKTETQYRSTLGFLISLVGDVPVNRVEKKDARELIELICKLPPNIKGTHSAYKGMSLKEIVASNPSKKLSSTTIGHHITRLKSFFNWTQANYDELNANPFKGLKAPKQNKAVSRETFTSADIVKIFSCYLYNHDEWPSRKSGKQDSKFWIPLILALTGCRLNEASQLYTDDICKEEGIWAIDFNESRSDQKLKGTFARKVPLHRALVKIGFPEFVEQQRKAGHARLFPELTYSATGDGYGRSIGEFCRDLFENIGVTGTPHSFRHNVTQILTSKDVDLKRVQAIIGHKGDQSVTESSYGANKFTIPQKLASLDELDYGVNLGEISYALFKKRTS